MRNLYRSPIVSIFSFLILFPIITLIALIKPIAANAAGPIVWLEDGMTWIYKDSPAKSNPSVTLYTAKNEYETFQIVIKAPSSNSLSNVNVDISNLTGPGGAVIKSSNITLYREHYLYVTQGTKTHSSGGNRPLGPGWYPDALIPFVNPNTGADLTGRFDAAPFNVNSGENQPIWVDVFTPSNTPAGQYNGNITVTSNQGSVNLNINLSVWNFTLPKIRSLKGHTKVQSMQTRTTAIEILKHRLNPKNVNRSDERFLIDNYALDMVSVFRTSGAQYGNCSASSPPSVSEVLNATTGHEPELFLYTSYANEVWDCGNLAQTFLNWGRNLRAGNSHPIIVTYPTDALLGSDLNNTAADIWAILPKHYDGAKTNIDKVIANPTTDVWFYNPFAQEGYSPKFTIDFLPINSRIFHGFIGQSMGARGFKFWKLDNWPNDPWTNAEQSKPILPGEGHMVYPGADVGLSGHVVPSVRLKLVREGSEDFEYIEILKSLGQKQYALNISKGVGSDFHNWTKDKNVLLSARRQLGDKIHSLDSNLTPTPTQTQTSPTPTPSLPGDGNNDRLVDGKDFIIWLIHFGQNLSGANNGDYNDTGKVEIGDYLVWINNY